MSHTRQEKNSHKRKEEELTPNTSELKVDMQGLVPPIHFSPCDTLPGMGAIYIEAFHEIFTEVQSDEERLSLLQNIDQLIPTDGVEAYIDIAEKTELCVTNTRRYIGPNSHIEKLLKRQQEQKTELHDFKEQCKKKNIHTVYVGGVYGRNCAWNAARTFARNLFAKQLGDKHPNVRFDDLPSVHRFENAVIWPAITEGYIDFPFTFPDFVIFSGREPYGIKHLAVPGFFERAEEELQKKEPEQLGLSYEENFDEFDNPENYSELFNQMIGMVAENNEELIAALSGQITLHIAAEIAPLICEFAVNMQWGLTHNLFNKPRQNKKQKVEVDSEVALDGQIAERKPG